MAQDTTKPGDILEYTPKLEYTPGDINAVDNIADAQIEPLVASVVNSGTANNLIRVKQTKDLLEETRLLIDKKLDGVVATFNKEALDDIIIDNLSGMKDASRLINDGIITYPLYKEIKNNPALVLIKDAWDEYHCGMEGSIEAEMLPYVDAIGDILNNITRLVDDSLLYDEDPMIRADGKKLRESEIDLAERYVRLRKEIKEALKEANETKYITAKKQFDAVENKIKYRKNINLILSDALAKIANTISIIQDGTIDEFMTMQHDAISVQIKAIERNVNISNIMLRTLIYSSFTEQYNTVLNLKRNHENVMNSTVRQATFRAAIKDMRLYRDVAVPSMIELSYADEQLPIHLVGEALASGIEDMARLHKKSVLGIKNILESDIGIMNQLINKIYEKYRTRTMYKIVER